MTGAATATLRAHATPQHSQYALEAPSVLDSLAAALLRGFPLDISGSLFDHYSSVNSDTRRLITRLLRSAL